MSALQPSEVRRSGTLGGLVDVELYFLSFLEVRAADVFHVEEHVVVRILSVDKSVAASVVEEVNLTFRHYTQRECPYTDNPSESRATMTTPTPSVLSVARVRPGVTLDRYIDLDPAEGEIHTEELVAEEDVLVKAFALGPGAELSPHDHGGSTNVFHVLEGRVTVIQDEEEEEIDAPGVVLHERGVVHGARNDTDERAVLTASLCPLPS